MEKKYINENRYKKGVARKRRDATTVKSNLKSSKPKQIPKITKKKQTPIKKKTRRKNKKTNIVISVFILTIIAIFSRAILKDEESPFIPLPFVQKENDNFVKIGIVTSEGLLENNTNNIVINEINKYCENMLLEINEDYSITYKAISSIEKVSNSEYIITKNTETKFNIEELKNVLDKYRKDSNSKYYSKLINIDSIDVVNENSLKICLKQEDEYFIYNLEIPFVSEEISNSYIKDLSSTDSKLVYIRHEDADVSLPAKIIITKYADVYSVVQAYKQKEIDIFVTNAENVKTVLGKCEYAIASYRNGQSVFLFGNSESEIFSRLEVRQAIAYSIDRDKIIQELIKSKGTKIDLPYIYDSVRYKYDIYAAENLLLTNGYKKSGKVYSKIEKGKKYTLELDLLVNKNDELKINIANKIKNNLGAVGIRINVISLDESKLEARIKNGEYDLVLANVNLNNSPDIKFLSNHLVISEEMNKEIQLTDMNINNIAKVISDNISTIGIYSDISYLVYRSDLYKLENVSYLNLFSSILE